jgi:catechol 2,3-dioxygenase-like lactoylglutathione lyase family enzyme
MAIQRFSHIGVCVSDLDRSLRFYSEGLGFRRAGSLEIANEMTSTLLELEGVALRASYLERDGVRIELLHYSRPGSIGDAVARPMNALGLTHLSLRVDDLAGMLPGLEGLGGRVLERTRVEQSGIGVAAVFVTDPDGTRIELVQAPGDPSALPAG